MVNVNFNKLTTRQVRALLRDPNNREDGTLVGAAVAKNLIGPDYFVSVAKRLRTYFGNNPKVKYSRKSLVNSTLIKRYKEKGVKRKEVVNLISEISQKIVKAKNLGGFIELIDEHENIISNMIELPTVKQQLFSDYFGAIKSLGAWGGDFILATGDENTPEYFKERGYTTILSYSEMVL